METTEWGTILNAFDTGALIPYIGPGVLSLTSDNTDPQSPEELAGRITAHSPVPAKLRKNLTGAAQFIENFKHRHTLKRAMHAALESTATPHSLHHFIAAQTALRLVVHAWYDSLMTQALARRTDWMLLQGVSRAEHRNTWYRSFDAHGTLLPEAAASTAQENALLLYAPLGGQWPEANYLVSDSDFVEVLTEIDIQTPIPSAVQSLRKGRSFLFLGCRFNTQLERIFAHQIMKRSSDRHWAVLAEEPTRNEARFLAQHNIIRIAEPLAKFAARLIHREPTR